MCLLLGVQDKQVQQRTKGFWQTENINGFHMSWTGREQLPQTLVLVRSHSSYAHQTLPVMGFTG